MATRVNLDALIPREDFEAESANDDAPAPQTITIRDLEEEAFFYLALRKPDFQRESAEWEPDRVAKLVKTFIDGDLIPAVILWKHREHLFVIDGSHRLSALIAWVQDDYGDGDKSKKFFGDDISSEQLSKAEQTRKLIDRQVGSYRAYVSAARQPQQFGPDLVASSRALGSRTLSLQWVRGDSTKAERSFIRINQQAATITPQELAFIEGRDNPDIIAARAVVRRGLASFQRGKFEESTSHLIRTLSAEIHRLLFEPELSYPIKNLHLPAGGLVYSPTALKMVHDFVVISAGQVKEEADKTGERTVDYLKRAKRVAELICSNKPSSIGLHPAVYFYSWTGKQQPILFLTMSEILVEFERAKKLPAFLEAREALESFIIGNRALFNQIVRKFGTKDSGKSHLKNFYYVILDEIRHSRADSEIIETLKSHKDYTYLQPSESPYTGVSPTRYSAQVKSGLVPKEMLPTETKCPICRGLIPSQAISIDHKRRRAAGGESDLHNLQITHPYCNTGARESPAIRAKLSLA